MNSVRLALSAAASMMLLVSQARAAQTAGPDAEVTAVVDAAMKAGMAGDIPKLVASYAPDCIFVDEFEPFFWSGPGAMQGYFSSAGRMYEETQHKGDKAVFRPPSYVYVSGDRAFVVERVSGTATVRGKPYAGEGAFAFTLSRIDGRWKITSQTWTKSRENMNPY
jgi:ketosteroid isomerase-like protein